MNEKKSDFLMFGGLPWYLYLLFSAIVAYLMSRGVLSTDFIGFLGITGMLTLFLYKLGEKLPIWNTYIGGGLLMVFFGVAALKQADLIPVKYVKAIMDTEQGTTGLLTVFIIFLILGSILALDRKVLIRSFAGYIPALFGSLLGASIFGIAIGLVFGVTPPNAMIQFVLPIMGGGNGAGAIPLSQIYEQVTGQPAANYYSFAIIILTIANLICILAGALLDKLGEKKPEWTGDRTNIMPTDQNLIKPDLDITPSKDDYRGALFLAGTAYAVGLLCSKILFPVVLGAKIHAFAYTILFVVILAVLGVIPPGVRMAAKKIQFFTASIIAVLVMVCMGVDFDLGQLAAALTFSNVLIALMVVIGAIIGSALTGKLVGFYPIDTAITAGLCMANRGGAGDVAVLGAARRLELISYAQLSSRVGGGIVLVVASFIFSIYLR